MMRALLIAVAMMLTVGGVAEAKLPDGTVRVRTTKGQLTGWLAAQSAFKHYRNCTGYEKNKAGRALTWRCTVIDQTSVPPCGIRFRFSKIRPADDPAAVRHWYWEPVDNHCVGA
jgi:hypothetical protein